MKLLAVSVSKPRVIAYGNDEVSTGIFKEPVDGAVMLRELNLDGDGQADLKAHGGVYKAVYVYPHEHYAYWSEELGRADFGYGQFGENFTVEGMIETDVNVGDIYRMGDALVQVTQPRVPCFKLAKKMEIRDFVKTFMQANKTGFYLRMLEEGEVEAGNEIMLVTPDPVGMSVAEMFHLLYFDKENVDDARRALQIQGMSPGWRGSFESIVAKADS